MPKKTKRQKLGSFERKKSELLRFQNQRINHEPDQIIKVTVKPIQNVIEAPPAPAPVQEKIISYFFSDLKKSLYFIVCIIALEIILYFARIKR